MEIIPKKVFLTKGKGVHKDRIFSFELALRDARIEKYNLVPVSSIIPPNCKIISRDEGIKFLKDGQVVFCVMARNETSRKNQLISSGVGIAASNNHCGYIFEHNTTIKDAKSTRLYAEKLAKEMLVSSFNQDNLKDIVTANIGISTINNHNNTWTTIIAAAIFL